MVRPVAKWFFFSVLFIPQFLLQGSLSSCWLYILSALKSEDWVSEVITSLFENSSIFFLSRWRLISWTLLFLFHRNLLQYLHVTAGEHDLRLKESSEQTLPVKSVIQHPKSDPRTPMNYDIALLKLDGTLNFSKARVSCDLLLHEEKVIVLCLQKINCQYEINFTDSTKITILFFWLKTPKHL